MSAAVSPELFNLKIDSSLLCVTLRMTISGEIEGRKRDGSAVPFPTLTTPQVF